MTVQEPSQMPYAENRLRAGRGPGARDQSAVQARYYVYCVLGRSGIPGRRILGEAPDGPLAVVTGANLAAVVGPAPAALEREGDVVAWVERHATIVARVRQECPDVLPLRMGAVFTGRTDGAAKAEVAHWLEVERQRLSHTLARVRGHDEYGLEAWCPRDLLVAHASARDAEVETLQHAIPAASNGTAYLMQARLDRMLEQRSEEFARQVNEALLETIRGSVREVSVARLPRGSGQEGQAVPLLALSALVERSRAGTFVTSLEGFRVFPGIQLRLTGPMPPYSFVEP